MPDSTATESAGASSGSEVLKLIVSWLWVGIPAAWGIWHVTRDAIRLFR